MAALRAEIVALKAEQDAEIARIRERTDARITSIEAALARVTGDGGPKQIGAPSQHVAGMAVAPGSGATPSASTSTVTAATAAKFQTSGDFRLRYEGNSAAGTGPARNRGVLRARFGARYDATDWLSVGGRLATGDPDDPNSTDVTLSDFADDLNFSLDQAWLRIHRGAFEAYGGKIPNPFTRTELVWDGDVNPDGVSASWRRPLPGGVDVRLNGLYFLINEQAAGDDSGMAGVQLGLAHAAARGWAFEFAAAYYDYDLSGVVGADSGDWRSNLLTANGIRYLSDFNLVDAVGSISYTGNSPAWPIKLTADVVKNTGAATDADLGYSLDASFGRISAVHDLRVTYGYAVAETDAVFAAFSHDNTAFATNYRQHTLTMDYMPWKNIVLNGTWYHYRADDAGLSPIEWLDRVRLNFLVQF